jgi:L-ascorbate metabolism protein UlaG (beta-lactamase superfamily)
MFSSAEVRFFKQLASDYRRVVPAAPHRPDPARWRPDQITVSWLGHATVLLNVFGVTILTDPVLGSRIGLRVGPFIIGPKRYVAAALGVDDLPPIDVILLTHAHMDHLDRWTLDRLPKNSLVVTARGTADLLRPLGFTRVVELGWGKVEIFTARGGDEMKIEAMEVKHWGARMRRDNHRGYNGYLLEVRGKRVGFSGDTAFTSKFKKWRRPGGIDLLAMPIGAYDPWIGSHCTPEQAVQMADWAGAQFIVPVHHQTFKLSWEPMSDPIVRFERALAGQEHRIALREIGETFVLP